MPRLSVRFSLRTLMIVLTLASFTIAITMKCYDARQRNSRAAVTLSGVGMLRNRHESQPWSVGWRNRASYFLHGFDDTKLIDSFASTPIFKRGELSDDHALSFLELENLEYIAIDSCSITDRSMEVIAKLSALEGLAVTNTPVTSNGLQHFRAHPTLRYLNLDKTFISDDVCEHVATIANLLTFGCSETPIGDVGLRHLTNCRSIEEFRFDFTEVTDDGVSRLASLPRLTILSLKGTKVRGNAFAQPGFSGLHTLFLDGSLVDDEGMYHISQLPGLRCLSIEDTDVTETGLAHLRNASSLAQVYARSETVSAELEADTNEFLQSRSRR